MDKLNNTERIIGTKNLTVGDFWAWGYSDIMMNTTRSTFAEFLVGSALGLTNEARQEWDAVDLRYQGKGIEVKSAAYLQSWSQKTVSSIRFDIAKKRSWDSGTDTYAGVPVRSADCYVFCLYAETNSEKANILDLSQWQFFVILTAQINQEFGNQKSIGLSRIQNLDDPVQYEDLKAHVDWAIS